MRPDSVDRESPVLPSAMLVGLGRRSTACEEAAAVTPQISARLLRRRNAALDAPPPLLPMQTATSNSPSTVGVSARLAAALQMRAVPADTVHDTSLTVHAATSAPAQPASKPIARLSTEVIAGMRVLAVPESRARLPTIAKRRKTTALKDAAHACQSPNPAPAGEGDSKTRLLGE